jgi:hypothetical protein
MADIEELHEHAHHAAADVRHVPVTLSMAILAVFVAAVSLMGERVHADAVLAETRAADLWSEYQAQVIRSRSYQVFLDELSVFSVQDPSQVAQIKSKYSKEIDRYTKQTKALQQQAYATEADVRALERRSNWFDLAAVLLEASLVICSITLLTQRRIYWYVGSAGGLVGIITAFIGLFIR